MNFGVISFVRLIDDVGLSECSRSLYLVMYWLLVNCSV